MHAVKVHSCKRGSEGYTQIMRESLSLEEESEEVRQVRVGAGSVSISSRDGVKDFLDDFKSYLERCTACGPATVEGMVRHVGDVVRYAVGDAIPMTLQGPAVLNFFKTMDSED